MKFTGWNLLVSLCLFSSSLLTQAQPAPTVIADLDNRANISLNGDWHFMVDPYASGTIHLSSRSESGRILSERPAEAWKR